MGRERVMKKFSKITILKIENGFIALSDNLIEKHSQTRSQEWCAKDIPELSKLLEDLMGDEKDSEPCGCKCCGVKK
jgi:hypothetical protein